MNEGKPSRREEFKGATITKWKNLLLMETFIFQVTRQISERRYEQKNEELIC